MQLEESDLGRPKQLRVVHLWVVVSIQWSWIPLGFGAKSTFVGHSTIEGNQYAIGRE